MAATSEAGMRAIPLTLLMLVLLKLIPGDKQASMSAEIATFSEAHAGWYCETLTELLDFWQQAGSSRLWQSAFHCLRPPVLTSGSSAADTLARWF